MIFQPLISERWVTSSKCRPQKWTSRRRKKEWLRFVQIFSRNVAITVQSSVPVHGSFSSACRRMLPHTNVVVTSPGISLFQSPTTRTKNKICAHWQLHHRPQPLTPFPSLKCFHTSSLQTHRQHEHPLAVWIIWWPIVGLLCCWSSEDTFILNADFMKCL